MSKNFITLSEKHGVNPSITVCFYCGKETGIALLGKLKNDEEAPRYLCNTIEPCDECKKKYKDYVLILEKDKDDANPSGRWIAVKKEYISPEHRENQIMFMSKKDFDGILELKKKGV